MKNQNRIENILHSVEGMQKTEANEELFDGIYATINKPSSSLQIKPFYISLLRYAAVVLILFTTLNVISFVKIEKNKLQNETSYTSEDFLKEYQVIRL